MQNQNIDSINFQKKIKNVPQSARIPHFRAPCTLSYRICYLLRVVEGSIEVVLQSGWHGQKVQ